MTNWGERMMKSGAEGVGKAAERTAKSRVELHNKLVATAQKEGKKAEDLIGTKGYNQQQGFNQYTEQQAQQRISGAGTNSTQQALEKFRKKATPTPATPATPAPATSTDGAK